MSGIVPFDFEGAPVRVLDRDGQPWFVLADVCRVLEIANSRDAAARLDDDERGDVGITDAIGREQATAIINESGLYSLILTSRKPEAKRFKRWVTHDVLPAIRRTGAYGTPDAAGLAQLAQQLAVTAAQLTSLTTHMLGADRDAAADAEERRTALILAARDARGRRPRIPDPSRQALADDQKYHVSYACHAKSVPGYAFDALKRVVAYINQQAGED